jgi:hypothetical protein
MDYIQHQQIIQIQQPHQQNKIKVKKVKIN